MFYPRNQNGERQNVQAQSANICVLGTNGVRADGRGTGTDERGHQTTVRREVARVYDGESSRSDTIAARSAEMGADTRTGEQRSI